MQYKTIVLELLKQRREIHDRLCKNRMLLLTVELCASGLKASHEDWIDQLMQASPQRNRNQIASEALELALKELENSLGLAK